ncbi:MAG: DUF1854 domain-containing protein [Planctomycetes bacterium]|nr:DUF1854 domain-containing protein [Planctomycetota bacterium]
MHFHDHGGAVKAADSGPSLPMPDATSSEMRMLDPAAVQFRREGARLQYRSAPGAIVGGTSPSRDVVGGMSPSRDTRDTPPTTPDTEWADATLVRLFPLSEPERWIALIAKDGKESGIVRDLAQLPPEPRRLAREELRGRYLVPQIQRILACRVRDEVVQWTVQTDRGRKKLLTKNLREQVKEPLPDRLTLLDVEGNRYDVPSLAALDPDSRRRLEAQL